MSSTKVTDSVSDILGVSGRLRALASKSAKNKTEFLQRLDMKRAQWRRYETGERLPEGEVLERICELTKRSPKWILSGREDDRAPNASPASSLPSCQRPHVDELERTMEKAWRLVGKVWKQNGKGSKEWKLLMDFLEHLAGEEQDSAAQSK